MIIYIIRIEKKDLLFLYKRDNSIFKSKDGLTICKRIVSRNARENTTSMHHGFYKTVKYDGLSH